jgi:hypothetical protein
MQPFIKMLKNINLKRSKLALKKRVNLTEIDSLKTFLKCVSPVKTHHPLIRIGGGNDGGYLLPDDLTDIKACFSPGIADSATFELDLANMGIPSFMADYSVNQAPVQSPLFHFQKKFIGLSNDSVYMTLGDWVASCAPVNGDLILQMDIEGAEYGSIIATNSDILTRFRIIVIEFHDLDNLFYKYSFHLMKLAFDKLLTIFAVVHIHPNNYSQPIRHGGIEIPPLLEFTFLRKDRFSNSSSVEKLPHTLDAPCCPNLKDFELPRSWYNT